MNSFEKLFPTLSDNSRIWLFPFSRSIEENTVSSIENSIKEFLAEWKSHGAPVTGEFLIVLKRILLVSGTVENGVSGCSIDSLFRGIKTGLDRLGLQLLDSSHVLFLIDEIVYSASREEFKAMIRSGRISHKTQVLDLTVTTLGQVRQGGLVRPISDTWHGKAFQVQLNAV